LISDIFSDYETGVKQLERCDCVLNFSFEELTSSMKKIANQTTCPQFIKDFITERNIVI